MRFDCQYDLVVEMDYPLGESSDLAYDTWGRDVQAKVEERFSNIMAVQNVRVVRAGRHLKISLRVWAYSVLSHVMTVLLRLVMPHAPQELSIHLVERERETEEIARLDALWESFEEDEARN